MPRSLARLSASESSHRDLFSVVFITNIAESDFWYTQVHHPIIAPFEWAREQSNDTRANLADFFPDRPRRLRKSTKQPVTTADNVVSFQLYRRQRLRPSPETSSPAPAA
jgi:hypothetical protein